MAARRVAARTQRQLARLVPSVSIPSAMPWPAPTEQQERLARSWFGGSHKRLLGAAVSVQSAHQINAPGLNEIALAGRSNVGKSSLLNAVLGVKSRANVSSTPGKTRELHMFGIGHKTSATGILTDLPGYGFARISKGRRAALHSLISDYCIPNGAANPLLRRVFLLLDSKVGATDLDMEFAGMLERAGVPFQLVVTKVDAVRCSDGGSLAARAVTAAVTAAAQLSPSRLADSIVTLRRAFALSTFEMVVPQIQLASADAGFGIDPLRALMVQAIQEGGSEAGARAPAPRARPRRAPGDDVAVDPRALAADLERSGGDPDDPLGFETFPASRVPAPAPLPPTEFAPFIPGRPAAGLGPGPDGEYTYEYVDADEDEPRAGDAGR